MVLTKHAQTDPIAGTSPSASSPKRVKLGSPQAGKKNSKGKRGKGKEIGDSGAVAKMELDGDEGKDGEDEEDEKDEKDERGEKEPTTTSETKEAIETEAKAEREPEAKQ